MVEMSFSVHELAQLSPHTLFVLQPQVLVDTLLLLAEDLAVDTSQVCLEGEEQLTVHNPENKEGLTTAMRKKSTKWKNCIQALLRTKQC